MAYLKQGSYPLSNSLPPGGDYVPSYDDVTIKCGSIEQPRIYMDNADFERWLNPNLFAGFKNSGFALPYQMQRYCLPYMNRDYHCVVHAERGSGKTVAALMVVLNQIAWASRSSTVYQAVIVCKTMQTAKESCDLVEKMAVGLPNIKPLLVIRGKKPSNGCINEQIIIGTPDKIQDLKMYFNNNVTQLLVIDEAEDIKLDRGYHDSITRISKHMNCNKVILLCAAPCSGEMSEILNNIVRGCLCSVQFPFVPRRSEGNHQEIFVQCSTHKERQSLIDKVSRRNGQIMFICDSKEMCKDVAEFLENKKYVVLNGKVKDLKRNEIRADFISGKYDVLVTTRHFSSFTTPCLNTVVNCADVLSADKSNLDHSVYQTHADLLRNSPLGLLVNAISSRWVNHASDLNGAKLKSVPLNEFRV